MTDPCCRKEPVSHSATVPASLLAAAAASRAAVFACTAWLAFPLVLRPLLASPQWLPGACLLACILGGAGGALARRSAQIRRTAAAPVGSVPVPVSVLRVASLTGAFSIEAVAAVSLVLGLAAAAGVSPDDLSWMLERAGVPGLAVCASFASAALVMERLEQALRLHPQLLLLSSRSFRARLRCGVPRALCRRLVWTLACLGILFCAGLDRHSHAADDMSLLAASVLLGTAAAGWRNCLDPAQDIISRPVKPAA